MASQIIPGISVMDVDSTPEQQLNRTQTIPLHVYELPVIRNDDRTPLDKLLRRYEAPGFWPLKLLRHLLSRDRVHQQLMRRNQTDSVVYINKICGEYSSHTGQGFENYLKIFTLLVLAQKEDDFPNFIAERFSDEELPVEKDKSLSNVEVELCKKNQQGHPACFQRWKPSDREWFNTQQWQVLTPFFELDSKGRAQDQVLDPKTILPWITERGEKQKETAIGTGGYSDVWRVQIHPLSHGFPPTLGNIELENGRFALKMLIRHKVISKTQYQEQFDRERAQLQSFSGLVHPHLVTLLATFTHLEIYHFLFPCARCNLDEYWDDHQPTLEKDLPTWQWFSKQCLGIVEAVSIIHEPTHLHSPGDKRYGRHGDIKPENILWFASSDDKRGILVISDMGLSEFHREISRSGITGSKVRYTPEYRPPECDVEGGKVSRSFDVWTLGCLLMEMVAWLLGGKEYKNQFGNERETTSNRGSNTREFFLISIFKRVEQIGNPQPDEYVAQVKPKVTKWFDKMHNHEDCTNFVHDILDVIEHQMLVVLEANKGRTATSELKKTFQKIDRRCRSEPEYCLKVAPRSLSDPSRSSTAVRVILSEDAVEQIREHNPELPVHPQGSETKLSKSSEELKAID